MNPDLVIGWIGVGRIGLPMASCLLAAGYKLRVFDTDASRLKEMENRGASIAPNMHACALDAHIVFTSLPNDQALEAVALGPAGLIEVMGQGGIFVDTSTVSPQLSRRINEAAQAKKISYLRMPVSGNPEIARLGRAGALASGPVEAWNLVKPVVASFTASQAYLGPDEQARYFKLVVNCLVANFAPLMAEALTLGRKGGLEWTAMLDALAQTPLCSPWLLTKINALKARDFSPTFPPAMIMKDIDLMLDAARDLQVCMPVTAHTRQVMQGLVFEEFSEEDFFVTVKAAERQAGIHQPENDGEKNECQSA